MAKNDKVRASTDQHTPLGSRLNPLGLAVSALLAVSAPQAFAADEAAQEGYKVGEFHVIPTASVTERLDDNIYGQNTGALDDTITNVAASVQAKSQWQRHRLNLDAGVSADYYNDYDSEDVVDWWAGADGRYDLSAKSHALGGVRFSQEHEDRASPETEGFTSAAEPTIYSTSHAHLGFAHRLAPFTIRIGAVYEALNYDDVASTTPGTPLDNDYRDRDQYSLGMRFSYQMKDAPEIFFQASTDTREYDDATTGRDSDGYRLGLGLRFDKGPQFQAEGFIGYLGQDFDNLAYDDVDTIYYGANLKWRPTNATRVSAYIDRAVNETTLDLASSYLNTTIGGQVEHDMTSRLALNASLSYSNSDYQGVDLELDEIAAGVGARYYFDKRFYLGGGYRHTNRDANQAAYEYDKNIFFLSLGYAPRSR
jgi:hypothetical protein